MNIGCGLFGLGIEMQKDFAGTMKILKDYGFTAVEPILRLDELNKIQLPVELPQFVKDMMWSSDRILEIKPILEELGLVISSAHINFIFGKTAVESVPDIIEFSKATGVKHFITSMNFSDYDRAKEAAWILSETNRLLNPHGITLSYHNHETESQFIDTELGNMTALDYFMAISDDCVTIQLDTGWLMYGGGEILPFIEKYKDRIISIHLKDFKEGFESLGRDEGFAAIGHGILPVPEILKELPKLHMMEHGLMIDQDMAAKGEAIMDDLKKGMEYLKKNDFTVK